MGDGGAIVNVSPVQAAATLQGIAAACATSEGALVALSRAAHWDCTKWHPCQERIFRTRPIPWLSEPTRWSVAIRRTRVVDDGSAAQLAPE